MLRSCRRQICHFKLPSIKLHKLYSFFTPRRPNLVPELERVQNWNRKEYSRFGKVSNQTDPQHCWVKVYISTYCFSWSSYTNHNVSRNLHLVIIVDFFVHTSMLYWSEINILLFVLLSKPCYF